MNNIEDAQLSQQKSYAKRHPLAVNIYKLGDKVLVKNLRREDRREDGFQCLGSVHLPSTKLLKIKYAN